MSSSVEIGVWDQVCGFGRYQHETVDGTPCLTVHDASTCKAMLDDFAKYQACDIFYDKQHEVVEELGDESVDRDKMLTWARGDGHALAWANAMVMIVGGQVVRYERHAGAPDSPPSAEEILRQSDGELREDGVYCLRSEVTTRGADPSAGLSAFRMTSPYFVPEKDGHRLLCLTVTNDPRMRGCALAYSRGQRIAMSRIPESTPARSMQRSHMENRMDEMMSRAGCMENDSPEQKLEKMTAYLRKMEDDCKKKDEDVAQSRKKMEDDMAAMKRAMEDKAGDKKDDEKKDEDGKAAMQAMQRKLVAFEEKFAGVTKELAETRGKMADSEALVAKTRKADAHDFARGAISMGRIRGDHKGDIGKTETWLAEKYIKDQKDAEDVLAQKGTFKPSEPLAMQRLGHNPRGEKGDGPTGESLDLRIDGAISAEIRAAKEKGETLGTASAMQRARIKHAPLFKEWDGRSAGRLA